MTQIGPTIPNHRRQILIVDDEPDNLTFLEAILGLEGYQIHKAFDGDEAVIAVDAILPDLVVMDVSMPTMDGFTACREIKDRHQEDFVPVILLTGLSDSDSEVRGLDSGADEYVVKPPKKDEFLARVWAMLRIRDLQHHLHVINSALQSTNEKLIATEERVVNELNLLGDIQRSFLPGSFPNHPELEFDCFYRPSSSAGGDYYDVIEIGRDRYGIVIADVTGHGAPAAVIMAITHTLMNQLVNTFKYPSTALKVLNEELNEHLSPTYYVTMFYGILNHSTYEMTYASAGHDPMYIHRAATGEIEELSTDKGFPLKLAATDDYDEKTATIEPGDSLVLFTDGLVEVRRETDRELYGSERLCESIHRHSASDVKALTKGILEDVQKFGPAEAFHDDVSILTIRRQPEGLKLHDTAD